MNEPINTPKPALAWLALALLIPAPSIGAWCGMIAWPGPAGRVVFFASKIWIVLLPVLWHWRVDRLPIRVSKPVARDLFWGTVTGLPVALAIIGAYHLLGTALIDPDMVRHSAARTGLDHHWVFLAGAVYWCTANSLLEEYVWRWFTVSRFQATLLARLAAPLAALAFTLHHIVALSAQFPWTVTVIGSAGVFAGAAIWSTLYQRTGRVWAGYISHVWADLAVFYAGWRILFG